MSLNLAIPDHWHAVWRHKECVVQNAAECRVDLRLGYAVHPSNAYVAFFSEADVLQNCSAGRIVVDRAYADAKYVDTALIFLRFVYFSQKFHN